MEQARAAAWEPELPPPVLDALVEELVPERVQALVVPVQAQEPEQEPSAVVQAPE